MIALFGAWFAMYIVNAMAARGVHFALSEDESKRLLACSSDDELAEELEELEERWDGNWLMESDKAWDAMHRCLTDGTLEGDVPRERALCVLGGRELYEGDEYLARYVTPSEVVRVAAALRTIDHTWLAKRYESLAETNYDGPHDETDLEYTWENFVDVRGLFDRAAEAGRAVLFTVDQ